ATLSVAVTLVITNSIAAYHRGITLNQINTTGMDIVDDIRTAVQSSTALPVKGDCITVYANNDTVRNECETDGGKNFVVVKRYASVKIGDKPIGDPVPVFGAFCSGKYSYVWNSGYFFSESGVTVSSSNGSPVSRATLKYSRNNDIVTISDGKLLKVEDESRLVCKNALKSNQGERYKYEKFGGISNEFDITGHALQEAPVELLGKNVNLALYDLDSATPAENDAENSLFYSMSFILGTLRGGANVNVSGEFCATPGSNSSVEDFDYCAINKFNFAARTLGGKK
ncbi:hypothetical protein J6S37_02690, partial [Candidatus Saccharibacteria bacterium]|nr:hypothetical protein [Candidatus Saccharibacteria bacterium]